jgi:hypothetical protein
MNTEDFGSVFSAYKTSRFCIASSDRSEADLDFLWRRPTGVSLMRGNIETGRASLVDGAVIFEPSIEARDATQIASDEIDQWVRLALGQDSALD